MIIKRSPVSPARPGNHKNAGLRHGGEVYLVVGVFSPGTDDEGFESAPGCTEYESILCNGVACDKHREKMKPGSNPTITSYNASVVKNYKTTSSLVRFQKNMILFFESAPCSLLQRWR
jgi:hypothetical protein